MRAGKLPHVAAATVGGGRASCPLDAQAGVAPRSTRGLRAMCADEAAVRCADHVVMIASLEQLHHHWAEAAHLFALAQPAYVDAHGDESLELAELMNSRGECYLELGCRGRARVCLDQAHAIVLETNGADDPSLASITAARSGSRRRATRRRRARASTTRFVGGSASTSCGATPTPTGW